MADYDFFTPLFDEDEASVSERVFADADDDIDKRPGQIFHDLVMPVVIEMARMWDSVNAMASVTFLPWSYGPYLDYKGAYEIGLIRQSATKSYAEVTFYGENPSVADPQGIVVIPMGTELSTLALDDGTPSLKFVTQSEVIVGFNDPTGDITATPDPLESFSNKPSGSIYYSYTVVGRGDPDGDGGETRLSTGSLEYTDSQAPLIRVPSRPGATGYRIYRSETEDLESGGFYLIGEISADNPQGLQYLDTLDEWPADLGGDWSTGEPIVKAPLQNTTDRVTVTAMSVGVGEVQNVPAGSITQISVPIRGVYTVGNETPAVAGQDTETDEDYRDRLIDAVELWQGQGNKDDYVRWSLMEDAVDSVVVLSAGDLMNMAGEVDYINNVPDDAYSRVHVVLIGPDNTPVADSVVQDLQIQIDPSGWDEENEVFKEPEGHGEGFAPIGARVTVRSADAVDIVVNVEVHMEPGYTLDGANMTAPTYEGMRTAVEDYFKQLPGDGDVIWSEVLAAIVTAEGVANAVSLDINGENSLGSRVAISRVQVPYLDSFVAVDAGAPGP